MGWSQPKKISAQAKVSRAKATPSCHRLQTKPVLVRVAVLPLWKARLSARYLWAPYSTRLPDHENCRHSLLTCASQATVRLNQRFDHQPYSAQRDRAARPRRRTNCCTSSPGIGLNRRRMPVIFLCSVSTSAAIEACGGQREHLKSKMGTTITSSSES